MPRKIQNIAAPQPVAGSPQLNRQTNVMSFFDNLSDIFRIIIHSFENYFG